MARQNRRLELCAGCGSYTKVIEVDALTPFPLIAIEDLATLDLDEGAMGREYSRPPMFDLDAIDPPASACP
jgi:formate dehydrogenase maturation protein FdhE